MENENDDKISDLKSACQTTQQMYIHEAQLLWQRYNVLLVVNSMLLAMLGFVKLPFLSISISLAGIITCFLWYQITVRGFASTVQWARELENMEKSLPDSLKVFTRRRERISGSKRSWLSKNIFSVHKIAYCLIIIFFIMYVIFLLNAHSETANQIKTNHTDSPNGMKP